MIDVNGSLLAIGQVEVLAIRDPGLPYLIHVAAGGGAAGQFADHPTLCGERLYARTELADTDMVSCGGCCHEMGLLT
jgi:hypothetical protein